MCNFSFLSIPVYPHRSHGTGDHQAMSARAVMEVGAVGSNHQRAVGGQGGNTSSGLSCICIEAHLLIYFLRKNKRKKHFGGSFQVQTAAAASFSTSGATCGTSRRTVIVFLPKSSLNVKCWNKMLKLNLHKLQKTKHGWIRMVLVHFVL